MKTLLAIIGFVLLVGLVLGCVIALAVRTVGIHYDRAACHSYAAATGRETKFVTYTYWSWDCLTPSGDGKWISTDSLREFGGTP